MQINKRIFWQRMRVFAGDQSGGILIFFSLMLIVLLLCVGSILDFGSALVTRSSIGGAIDAAALGAAATPGTEDAEAVAKRYFEANYQTTAGVPIQYDDLNVTMGATSVEITSSASMDTNMIQVGSISSIPVSAQTRVDFTSKATPPDFDMVLVIDGSGSMGLPIAGAANRLEALKMAINDLVSIVKAEDNPNARVGMVEYGRQVIDPSTGAPYDSIWWYNDNPAVRYTTSKQPSDVKQKQGLTANKAIIDQFDDSLSLGADTCGECGLLGGMELFDSNPSPQTTRTDGTNYSKIRQMVLLTDGEFNVPFNLLPPDSLETDEVLAAKAGVRSRCQDIKTRGITLYTISYGTDATLGSADNKQLLIDCASTGADGNPLWFDAPDTDTIRAKFQQIANDVKLLRITK